jgi:ATP-binding cassette subfamily F protein 3
MEDYAAFVLDRARQAARAPSQVRAPEPVAAPPPPPAPRTKAPTGTARRRAEAAEAALARANRALQALDGELTRAASGKDALKLAELGRRRDAAQASLDAAEAEWLAAQEAYEAMVR